MNAVEFSAKFSELNDLMFGFAMRLTKNREDAKDLMQETAMRAYANVGSFRSGTNFKAWVSTIMRNSFINRYRKRKTRNEVEQPIEEMQYALRDKTVNSTAHSNIMKEEILGMVGELSNTYRIPFLMQFRGFEYKEIAEHLEIPIGTVKSRIFYARRELRNKIKLRYHDIQAIRQ